MITIANFIARSASALAMLSLLVSGLAVEGCDSDSGDSSAGTIYDVAVKNGFTTLVAAIDAAGLRSTLESDGPFTVFAPTDAAFAALPAGTLETLLQPSNVDALTNILTYHVVSGRVTSSQVVTLTEAATLQGEKLSVEVVNGSVFISGAEVTIVDVEADNGIIHVIDTVLLPGS